MRRLFILSALCALASTTGAQAQPRSESPGTYRHDGFYFRLGLGFTAFGDGLAAGEHWDDEFEAQGGLSGFGTANEFALGGTIGRGLVLGGGVFGASILATDFVADDDALSSTLPEEVNPSRGSLHLFGPFIDYYFNDRRGLHFEVALGVATLTGVSYDVGRVRDGIDAAVGGGFMVAVGHEWWVGEEWSMGVLGRLMAALVAQEDDDNVKWVHAVGAFPGVLFTVTYH